MDVRGQIPPCKLRAYLFFLVNTAKENVEMLLGTKQNERTELRDNACQRGPWRRCLSQRPGNVQEQKLTQGGRHRKMKYDLKQRYPQRSWAFYSSRPKKCQIWSKSQKQLSWRTFTAAPTTILKRGKLADRVSLQ